MKTDSKEETLIENYAKLRGWQGCTIHQAREDFISLNRDCRYSILTLLRAKLSILDSTSRRFLIEFGDLDLALSGIAISRMKGKP